MDNIGWSGERSKKIEGDFDHFHAFSESTPVITFDLAINDVLLIDVDRLPALLPYTSQCEPNCRLRDVENEQIDTEIYIYMYS